MGCWLPEEIMYEILVRLPAEDLIRFKVVCKSWYFLISHRKFVNAHLALAPRYIIFQFYEMFHSKFVNPHLSCICFNLEDLTLPVDRPLASLEEQLNRPVQLVTACNGLFLLKVPELALYNPVTRHYTTLPPPSPLVRYPYFTLFHGNSVDKSKVVMMDCKIFQSECFVLTLEGTTSFQWREVMCIKEREKGYYSLCSQFLVLENTLYWVAMVYCLHNDGVVATGVRSYYLFSMDSATELCTKTEVPIREDILKETKMFSLSDVKGSVCITIVLAGLIEMLILDKVNCQWARNCGINLQSLSHKPAFLESFLSENTCVVVTPCSDYESLLYYVKVLVHHEGQFFICDLKNNNLKRIGVRNQKLLVRHPLLHFSTLLHWE